MKACRRRTPEGYLVQILMYLLHLLCDGGSGCRVQSKCSGNNVLVVYRTLYCIPMTLIISGKDDTCRMVLVRNEEISRRKLFTKHVDASQ